LLAVGLAVTALLGFIVARQVRPILRERGAGRRERIDERAPRSAEGQA